MRRNYYCKVVLATTLFFFTSLGGAEKPDDPITGLWIVRDSMTDPESIDLALQFAKSGGFNHVFVQVRGRGDAYYNSLLVPRSPLIRGSDFDPLGYAVERAHVLGLKLHAWVNAYLLWSSRETPQTNRHIYLLFPDWLEQDIRGASDGDLDLNSPRDGNFEGAYLSPVHPDVNEYLHAAFSEIFLNYDVDGLHLDYCRYKDVQYGYNPVGVTEFIDEQGFDPRGLISDSAGRKELMTDAGRSKNVEIWNDYRRHKITELVAALRSTITTINREIVLTVAVKPNVSVARNRYLQDWTAWLDDGLIDYALPMNYTVDENEFSTNMESISLALPSGDLKSRVVMGVATYNQTSAQTVSKIRLAHRNGFASVCVFAFDVHKNNLSRFNPILDALNP